MKKNVGVGICFIVGALCFAFLGFMFIQTEMIHGIFYFVAGMFNVMAAIFLMSNKNKKPAEKQNRSS